VYPVRFGSTAAVPSADHRDAEKLPDRPSTTKMCQCLSFFSYASNLAVIRLNKIVKRDDGRSDQGVERPYWDQRSSCHRRCENRLDI
jgi:hypothetical protein